MKTPCEPFFRSKWWLEWKMFLGVKNKKREAITSRFFIYQL